MPKAKNAGFPVPALKEGEHYAGILLKDGKPSAHLILLPGDTGELTWGKAVALAKKQKGNLPTRQEQSLLFANLKSEFQPTYYWSGEEYADDSAYAWYQGFTNGDQYYWRKVSEFRARLVRRVPI